MALTEQFLLVEYVAWGYPARSTARQECADRQKITARYGIAARGPAGGARNRPATGPKPARNRPATGLQPAENRPAISHPKMD